MIENILPFNHLYYRICFYNALFSVLEYYEISNLYVFANNLPVYAFNKSGYLSDIQYVSELNELQLLNNLGLEVNTQCTNLIEDIKNSIDKNCPVIVAVDCYYLSIRKDLYQKEHWPHTLLVYGYDDERKIALVFEHPFRDSLEYVKKELQFNELEEAYKSYVFGNDHIFGGQSYFSFSRQKNRIDMSSPKMTYEKNFCTHREEVMSGIQQLGAFIDKEKAFFCTREFLDYHSSELLVVINNIINSKKADAYLLIEIYGQEDMKYIIVSRILTLWEKIRVTIVKYLYTKVLVKNKISKMYLWLRLIYLYEKKFLRCFPSSNNCRRMKTGSNSTTIRG
ncbi:BtrH N-terminal domain-containing protein [Enterocloster clostridioformis]